jgi:hypothetical protein
MKKCGIWKKPVHRCIGASAGGSREWPKTCVDLIRRCALGLRSRDASSDQRNPALQPMTLRFGDSLSETTLKKIKIFKATATISIQGGSKICLRIPNRWVGGRENFQVVVVVEKCLSQDFQLHNIQSGFTGAHTDLFSQCSPLPSGLVFSSTGEVSECFWTPLDIITCLLTGAQS